jgi:hypothetical protein
MLWVVCIVLGDPQTRVGPTWCWKHHASPNAHRWAPSMHATNHLTPEFDYTACTMNDVIARSLLMHPSLLADACAEAGKIHQQARDTMHDGEARRIAGDMAKVAWGLFCAIRDSELADVAALTFTQRQIAFAAAAKLNCLHYNLAHEIAKREAV